jgi:xylan 1,4-beta-xylosidase
METSPAVVWDFEQPEQKVSNRSFYTKVIPSHAAAPIELQVRILCRMLITAWKCTAPGITPTMHIPHTSRWVLPRDLSAEQIAHLNELTRDLPEIARLVRSGSTGTIEFSVPMNSNDIVLDRA